jgi:hypothetical protein
MYHDGVPVGCISDICPEGNDDILLSMKDVKICPDCTTTYKRYGCEDKALNAADNLLLYVREEARRYDKNIPYDVFISYSHEDREFVDRLAGDLGEMRLKVWRDGFRLLPGKMLIDQIITGIFSSKCLLCVLSPKAVESEWVNRELSVAVTKSLERGADKILVLPVLIENCKIPNVV